MDESFRKMNSALGDIEDFNGMARSLERSEERRRNLGLLQARKDVADRLGITPARIENFRSLRTKIVPAWLKDRIRAELISALEMEVRNLEHEINLHKQAGSHHSGNALCAAETQVALVRAILKGEMK